MNRPSSEAGPPSVGRSPAGASSAGSSPAGASSVAGGAGSRVVLPRSWYARPSLEVAPDLLGKLLVTADGRVARLVEVEAYAGGDDPGSHSYRGQTQRNRTMWGPPGRLYVYFTYGMHWCANAVCGPDGVPLAVLLRAAQPIEGLELMRAARWRNQRVMRDRDLCRGPARLAQALCIDRSYDGADLVGGDLGLRILDDGWTLPGPPAVTTRIGLSAGADLPWRWVVAGSPWASGRPTPLSG